VAGFARHKERLKTFGHKPTGKTGEFKDRLRALAIWRLFEKLGFEEMRKFAEANRIDKLPFHDARRGQTDKTLLNQAPICSEESVARHAMARAKQYLAKIFPWEFGKFKADKGKMELEQAEDWVKNLPPIS
jgi:hypothetical protein